MASINATTSSGIVATADNTGTLQLQTVGTNALNIDASQNVGIGTTSPSVRLNVFGSTTYSGIANGSGLFQAASGSTIDGGILLGSINGNTPFIAATNLNGGTGASTNLTFLTNATERMRIDTSGYVRINNTGGIDGQFSSVTGAWYAGAFANTDAAFPSVYSWNKATSGNNLFYQFYTETAAVFRGSIDYNRGAGQVRYNTTSDQRLKENIVDAPSAIDLINSVKIRSFDWKETGFHVDYGVIAQELNAVVPDAVSEGIDNEDGTIKQAWGVDTSVLVPALVKAIQELKAELDDLKAKVGK
jgi:hypothetical protein